MDDLFEFLAKNGPAIATILVVVTAAVDARRQLRLQGNTLQSLSRWLRGHEDKPGAIPLILQRLALIERKLPDLDDHETRLRALEAR